MLRKATNLINLPILGTTTQKRLGRVLDFVVEPHQQKIKALVLTYGNWLSPGRFISTADIARLGANAILVREEGAMVSAKELGLLQNYIRQKTNLLGFNAVAPTGKKIGRIRDFLFDEIDFAINRYQVQGDRGELIIESNKVIRIDAAKKIIVFQETELAPLKKETIKIPRAVSLNSR